VFECQVGCGRELLCCLTAGADTEPKAPTQIFISISPAASGVGALVKRSAHLRAIVRISR
jgi:hypothetical protein